MTGRPAIASTALAALALATFTSFSGCVNTTGTLGRAAVAPAAVVVPPPKQTPDEAPCPAAPRPSLSRLTNRQRPHLDFYGANIYADSISETGASGNVYLDGRHLHQLSRSFPIAVYAGRAEVDPKKEKITLSDWPLVQTDSAYIQAETPDTAIVLSRDRMIRIKGPARYVIGTKEAELFVP